MPSPDTAATNMVPPKVGQEIQRLRNERKLTLEDLSRLAGVSKSMLSEIERNRANPTIAVVWRLTTALGISLDELFSTDSQAEPIKILNAEECPTLGSPDKGYQLKVWGPIDLAGHFEWYELQLSPQGALISDAHDPGTMEHITVLRGSIEIETEKQSRVLQKGQTARYPADQAHTLRNKSKEIAKALLVVVHA